MKAFSSLLLAILLTGCHAGETAVPDFSSYPKSNALTFIIKEHASKQFLCLSIQPEESRLESLLLAITTFRDADPGVSNRYFVNSDGREYDCRYCHDWAVQASNTKVLSQEQQAQLQKAIDALPSTNVYPPLPQVAIVSFRKDSKWVTRTMPASTLKPIFGVIGKRQ